MAINKLGYVVDNPLLSKIRVKDSLALTCTWSVMDNAFIIPEYKLIFNGVEYGDTITDQGPTFNLVLSALDTNGVDPLISNGPVAFSYPAFNQNPIYAVVAEGGITGLGISDAKIVLYVEANRRPSDLYTAILALTDPMGTHIDRIVGMTPVFGRGNFAEDKPVYQNMPGSDLGSYVCSRLGYEENGVEFKGFNGGPIPSYFDGHDVAIHDGGGLEIETIDNDGVAAGRADTSLIDMFNGTNDVYGIFINYDTGPGGFITGLFVAQEDQLDDVRADFAMFGIPLEDTSEMYKIFQSNGAYADYTYVFNPTPPGPTPPQPHNYPNRRYDKHPPIHDIMNIEKELIEDVQQEGAMKDIPMPPA